MRSYLDFHKISVQADLLSVENGTMLVKSLVLCAIFGVMFADRVKFSWLSLKSEETKENSTEVVSNNDTARLPFNPCRGRYGPFCLDCRTLITCAEDMINLQTCKSMDPSKPYCKGTACSSEKIPDCIVDTLRCTSVGQFPHPTDCNSYFFCSDLSSEGATKLSCPSNYTYDSRTGWCKEKKVASDCKTISCSGKTNTYQVLPYDKSILAYCADTPDYKETIMFRCPDFVNMEYNPETLKCNFVCKDDGRYPDKFDCPKYYECFRAGKVLNYTHEQCPNSFKYDFNKGLCVIEMCKKYSFDTK